MIIDEFFFHRKRFIPRWELIGHPLDTLSTLLTLLIPVLFSINEFSKTAYFALAILSCLFITKDEFVHSDYCSKKEHWLHAMLFILHPVTFLSAYLLWINNTGSVFLIIQVTLISLFLIYQIIQGLNSYESKIKN